MPGSSAAPLRIRAPADPAVLRDRSEGLGRPGRWASASRPGGATTHTRCRGPTAYGELAERATRSGSHGRSPSMTRTPSSSSATSTWTCIPRVPALSAHVPELRDDPLVARVGADRGRRGRSQRRGGDRRHAEPGLLGRGCGRYTAPRGAGGRSRPGRPTGRCGSRPCDAGARPRGRARRWTATGRRRARCGARAARRRRRWPARRWSGSTSRSSSSTPTLRTEDHVPLVPTRRRAMHAVRLGR